MLPMELDSLLMFIVTPKPGITVEHLENALQQEIDNLSSKPITATERQRVQNQIEARKLRELQSVSSRADYLNMFNIYFNNPDLINSELERYRKISPEYMQEVARKYLISANRSVVTFLPENKEQA